MEDGKFNTEGVIRTSNSNQQQSRDICVLDIPNSAHKSQKRNSNDKTQSKQHVRTGELSSCNQCAYKTNEIGTLTRHMTTLINEKPFACNHCITFGLGKTHEDSHK